MTPNPAGAAGPLLSVEHLAVRFGATTVVDDVSFSIAPGEVLAQHGGNRMHQPRLGRSQGDHQLQAFDGVRVRRQVQRQGLEAIVIVAEAGVPG